MEFYSWDLLTREIVDEIPFSTWRFNEALNRPGGFACTIPCTEEKADPELLHVGRHAIFANDDGIIRFGGIIWTTKVNADRTTLTVGGEGLFSYFRDGRRTLRGGYTNTMDELVHVVFLITLAQQGLGENLGLEVRRNPELSGVTKTLDFLASDRKEVGQIIEDLADADDGFDFGVTPEWNGGEVALYLDLYYPERGADLGSAWELGTHVSLKGDWEEEVGANRIDAVGASVDGHPLIETASSPPTETLRIDRTVSYTDVTDSTILLALAKGERKRAIKPQGSASVVVENYDEAGLPTFGLGDTLALVGDLGYRDLDQQMRIVGYEASADEDETAVPNVTVDLEPA